MFGGGRPSSAALLALPQMNAYNGVMRFKEQYALLTPQEQAKYQACARLLRVQSFRPSFHQRVTREMLALLAGVDPGLIVEPPERCDEDEGEDCPGR